MIFKNLVFMDGPESLLKAYHYSSFRDFRLTIWNKLKMLKNDSFNYAPKLPTMILENPQYRKRPL